MKESDAKRKASQLERRQKRRQKLTARWSDGRRQPAVLALLRRHVWRMARLQRMRTIAVADNKPEMVSRIDRLITRATKQNEARMARLKGGAK